MCGVLVLNKTSWLWELVSDAETFLLFSYRIYPSCSIGTFGLLAQLLYKDTARKYRRAPRLQIDLARCDIFETCPALATEEIYIL